MNKRLITLEEAKKHDCPYCYDVQRSVGITRGERGLRGKYLKGKACPHETCPYAKEIDKYDTYKDYLKAQTQIWGPLIGKVMFTQ